LTLTNGRETKDASNVWEYAVGGNTTGHPAVFPEGLATDHILSWSNEGEIIYDPFMGSGTTGIAAIKTNRRFIGSEVSGEYVLIANNRLTVQPTLTVVGFAKGYEQAKTERREHA
jgi:DNA modification methylase